MSAKWWKNEFFEVVGGVCEINEVIENIELFCDTMHFDQNTMTRGYPKRTDTERIIKFEHKGIEIRTGNPEWGAEPGKVYFVIMHGDRIK